MKKLLSVLLAALMVFTLAGCNNSANGGDAPASDAEDVAVFWYNHTDAYLSSVRSAMTDALESAGVTYNHYDANTDQTTQTDQINTAIAKGVKVLVVNQVEASNDDVTKTILDAAAAANLPVVFFNRSVTEEVVTSYANTAYVGTDYTQAGHMEGKMVGDYVLANYDTVDLNGDGVISYVMFKGQEGNLEADARTQYGVEDADAILTAAGKPALAFYDADNANKYLLDLNGAWSNAASKDYMDTILSQYNEENGNMVELVIANNDDMALGAVNSLKEHGYNGGADQVTIPVFGVDAMDFAVALINEGSMTGTVKQDAVGMADAVKTIAVNFLNGNGAFDGINSAYELEGTWRVNIPYSAYNG
jgi:methyl-galactoside transport system substrate-binding protein